MKTTIQHPEKQYPYLAVWTNGEGITKEIKIDDIVVVSLVDVPNQDKKPYIQPLLGGKGGYFTTEEKCYTPIPKGTIITLEN